MFQRFKVRHSESVLWRILKFQSFLLIIPFLFYSFQQKPTDNESQTNNDSIILRKIYDEALLNGKSYEWLRHLCKNIGTRLTGSPQSFKAVDWAKQTMQSIKLDTVYLQELFAPHWERGEKESAKIIFPKGEKIVNIIALGGSIATAKDGITAEIVEVKSWDELKTIGEKIKGKIVFFNRPMNVTYLSTGRAYGEAVDQRGKGAAEAAKYGAVAAVVRSMTLRQDDKPHTGAMHYNDSIQKIPACAISTNDANWLSEQLKTEPNLKFSFKQNCRILPDIKTFNVIGEIRGTEFPNEIIAIGGHLDSWDAGEGAHDDGAGCMHSLEAIRILKSLNIRPKRTIRVVMFMNEENGLKGGEKYAEIAKKNNEKHIAAIESDGGGGLPLGFGMEANEESVAKLSQWKNLFLPYGIYELGKGWGGADIGPLRKQNTPLIGFITNNQRYFDYHHSANDVFENVNKRELELGCAANASLLYLISEYGF